MTSVVATDCGRGTGGGRGDDHLVIGTHSIGRGVDIRPRDHKIDKIQPELADVGADLGQGVLTGGGVRVGGGEARVLDVGGVLRDRGTTSCDPGMEIRPHFRFNFSLST